MSRPYPDRPLVGVGVVVMRGGKVLLVRRGKPPREGQWSLPGGAQELGETVFEAGRREVREETGVELRPDRMEHLAVVDMIERDEQGAVLPLHAGRSSRDHRRDKASPRQRRCRGVLDDTRRGVEPAALGRDEEDHRARPHAAGGLIELGFLALGRCEHLGKATDSVLVLLMLDGGEIAGQLEQHALLRHHFRLLDLLLTLGIDILEEIADLDAERLSDLIETAGRDPVDAGLVLMRLLIGHTDQLGHLLLRVAEHDPSLTDPQADEMIDVECPTTSSVVAIGGLAGNLAHEQRSL